MKYWFVSISLTVLVFITGCEMFTDLFGPGTVAAPTFSPPAGTYTSAQSVTIATATSGATIRYTTDGTLPTATQGTVYTGAIAVATTTTLTAIAYQTGWADSAVTSATYTLPAVVSTLAGSGAFGFNGFADGTGTEAKFHYPSGVAVDSAGTVYVADYNNHRIRKISPSGVVSTLAGSGAFGFADGTGTEAKFDQPTGVAVDSAGNVYVADTWNSRIRKISPSGEVSTLAGSGAFGFADGTGTAAKFNYPFGVAVDSSGNVYVADMWNNRIRKITPSGVVSTLAGSGVFGFADGAGTAAKFNEPTGVAVDSAGNVYVADMGNNRIRKITPSGEVSTLAGSGAFGFADGTGTEAKFHYPFGVAVDSSSNVYVADRENHRIRKITQ